MYKVFPDGGGWSVFWIESEDAEPRLVPRPTDDPVEARRPYPQRQAAYRRAKKLNDLRTMEKMVGEGGDGDLPSHHAPAGG
jgi:hypothetical protein